MSMSLVSPSVDMEDCIPKKFIQVFLKQSIPRVRSKSIATKLGDPTLYKKCRYNLHKENSDAKKKFTSKPEIPR